jgi:N-formylglutamate amidohydrolase
MGITVIQATHSRYVVNLNRDLKEPLFGPEREFVIPENTCFGKPLYDKEPDRSEIDKRIGNYYLPYHRRLTRILEKAVRDFGHVYLIDLHGYHSGPEVNVCLGNVNETSCSESLIGSFERSLLKHDFSVVRNEKWTGGYITQHCGSLDNIESLQIELRFPAYLEGSTFREEEVPEWDTDKFRNAKKRLKKVFNDVIGDLF